MKKEQNEGTNERLSREESDDEILSALGFVQLFVLLFDQFVRSVVFGA